MSNFNYSYACVYPWDNTSYMTVLVKFNIYFPNILGLLYTDFRLFRLFAFPKMQVVFTDVIRLFKL